MNDLNQKEGPWMPDEPDHEIQETPEAALSTEQMSELGLRPDDHEAIAVVAGESKDTGLEKFAKGLRISKESALDIISRFELRIADEILIQALSIVVTDESQTGLMAQARDLRLELKKERCRIENIRKDLKDEHIRKGRAIDDVANYLKDQISPVEEHLQAQEDFAKARAAEKYAALKTERENLLRPFTTSPITIDLAALAEDDFNLFLSAAKAAHEQRLDEQRREQEAAAERERQNELLRADNERLELERAEENRKRLDAEAEIQRGKEAEEAEQRRQADEAEKLRRAPDKEKILKFVSDLEALTAPEVETERAQTFVDAFMTQRNDLAARIRRSAEGM